MKTREIKELTTTELQEQMDAKREELNRLVLNHAISPIDNPAQIRDIRRTIARMATELRQRELQQK
ncbi:MAG: 50S ribosomal protein L29 [Paludibacteraceae bacterium]|nr:50S ribosomal protein L29 [Bacteroidales bacterium]MDY4511958.1 50S ribosomal protein L29 [Paludibacteraceae bacterium]MCI7430576.1 50S ribosomal protein L29 [Bacteroidales bacterium]MDD6641519.1 50S ribosomal protein L29 [Bacteroidales bacterium]MDD6782556.1 50S ribosomal protein L29 [Bacteroidales bacterium]